MELKLMPLFLSDIKQSSDNPRRHYSENDIETLAESIKKYGLLIPMTVRKTDSGYFLVAGKRRLLALKKLNEITTSCIVIEADHKTSAVFSAIENTERVPLDFFETAEALNTLHTVYNMPLSSAAKALKLTDKAAEQKLELLKLPTAIRDSIIGNNINETKAMLLSKVPADKMEFILKEIIQKKMTDEETAALVDGVIPKETVYVAKGNKITIHDYRIFTNSFLRIADKVRDYGVNAKTSKTETDNFVEYTLRIDK